MSPSYLWGNGKMILLFSYRPPCADSPALLNGLERIPTALDICFFEFMASDLPKGSESCISIVKTAENINLLKAMHVECLNISKRDSNKKEINNNRENLFPIHTPKELSSYFDGTYFFTG